MKTAKSALIRGFHPKYGTPAVSDKVQPSPEYYKEEIEFGKTAIFWSFSQILGESDVVNYQRFAWEGSFRYSRSGSISGHIDTITRAFYASKSSEFKIDEGLPSDASNEVVYKYSVASSADFQGHDSFLRVTEDTIDDHTKMVFGYEHASYKYYDQRVETIPGPNAYTVQHDKAEFAQNGLKYLIGDWWSDIFASNLA